MIAASAPVIDPVTPSLARPAAVCSAESALDADLVNFAWPLTATITNRFFA